MRLFGTAYLDLQCHPDYLSLIERNLRAYGINNPLSRSNPGHFKPLEAVERFLAEDLKTEDAVLLPNGFSSGQCLHEIAQQKVAEGQGLLVSKEGHLCYRNPRKEHTREKPAEQEGENGYGVLLDAVDPFTGHCDWLHSTDTKERLAKAAWVAIDLSHSYGVWESEVLFDE
jgi:hypothetical protein